MLLNRQNWLVVAPGTFIIGNNATQTTTSGVTGDIQQGIIVQAGSNGTANNIVIVGPASPLSGLTFRLTVYAATNATTISGALLGQTAQQTALAVGVNSFALTASVSIVSGNWYALMLHAGAGTWSGTASNGTVGDKFFSDTYSDGSLTTAPAGAVNSPNGRMIYLTT